MCHWLLFLLEAEAGLTRFTRVIKKDPQIIKGETQYIKLWKDVVKIFKPNEIFIFLYSKVHQVEKPQLLE